MEFTICVLLVLLALACLALFLAMRDVAALRDDLARLEKRLERLERQRAGAHPAIAAAPSTVHR